MAFTMIYNGEEFSADFGIKGSDYVRLRTGDTVVFEATGVIDFNVFEVTRGSWSEPSTCVLPPIKAKALYFKEDRTIDLIIPADQRIETGLSVSFVAPCDCSAVSSLCVNDGYPGYSIVDAMGNVMSGGSGGVWATGSLIAVVLDVENKKAYIQNPAFTKSRKYTATLSTTWTAAGTVYYQDVTVTGITEADDPIVDFVPQTNNATNVTLSGEMSKIFRVDTYEDNITVWASEKPTVSLPIRLKVV